MEQGISFGFLLNNIGSLGEMKIPQIDLRTEPCLPVPKPTEVGMIGWIGFILTFCLLTCLLQAYTSRWRSQICNMFFPMRAKSRAVHLYKKISAGRNHRRIQLRQLAITEKKKRDKLLEITFTGKICLWLVNKYKKLTIRFYEILPSKIQSVITLMSSTYGKETEFCHGCAAKEVKEKTVQKKFKDNLGDNVNVTLCDDCMNDF